MRVLSLRVRTMTELVRGHGVGKGVKVGHVTSDALGVCAPVDAVADRSVGNAVLCPARVSGVGGRGHTAILVGNVGSGDGVRLDVASYAVVGVRVGSEAWHVWV